MAKTLGVKVYAIGMGDSSGGFFRRGVDFGLLKKVAEATGGAFFRARSSAELQGVYEEIDKLETTEIDADPVFRYTDLAQVYLLLAGSLLCLGLFLDALFTRRVV
jgi:Ca-activated chloride channel family protein